MRSQLLVFVRNVGIIFLITFIFAVSYQFFQEEKVTDKEKSEKLYGIHERKLFFDLEKIAKIGKQESKNQYLSFIDSVLSREKKRLSSLDKITNVEYKREEKFCTISYNFEGLESLNIAIGIKNSLDFKFNSFYVNNDTIINQFVDTKDLKRMENIALLKEEEKESTQRAIFSFGNYGYSRESPHMKNELYIYTFTRRQYFSHINPIISKTTTTTKFNYPDIIYTRVDSN